MARRRSRSRPNYFNPNWKEGLTASEIGAKSSTTNWITGEPIPEDTSLAYNQAAADQSTKMRQSQLVEQEASDLAATKQYQERRDHAALGNALGISTAPVKDVWDEQNQRYVKQAQPPGFEQLKGVFASLPSNKQAEIYMKGGARHIDPESGAKMLANLQKTREEAMNSGIGAMASQLARGEVTHNPADGLFYRTISENDPVTGASKKSKVKISPLEAKYLYEGRERGMLPDWTGLKDGQPAVAATPDASAANVALSVGAKRDPFTAVHDSLATGEAGRYLGDMVGDVGIALTDSATGIANGYTRSRNAVSRLMSGDAGDQRAMIPKLSAQRPDDPMWVASQAESARQRAEEEARYRMANPIPMGY